jgi:aspartyl-tRNA(Asn)/glutamyl-tRNA(Gln) amidotransferase subunit B
LHARPNRTQRIQERCRHGESAEVAAIVELVESGTLTDRLARQVVEGVIAGEGTPQEVVDARGLAVVSDDGALIAAVDAALASQPDVLEKIRDGKVQAAGAIIGAVMKAMGGKADAACARELALKRARNQWCGEQCEAG